MVKYTRFQGRFDAQLRKYFPTFRRTVVLFYTEESKKILLALTLKTLRCFETSEAIYPVVECHISEDPDIQQHRCENLKSSHPYMKS